MTAPGTLVIACGALARELLAITRLDGLDHVTVECLPAALHNRPSEIPEAVRARIRRARATGAPAPAAPGDDPLGRDAVDGAGVLAPATGADGEPGATEATGATAPPASIFVAYADCGTGGLLARVCEEEGVEMMEGAHCYEFFASSPRFAELQDAEVGSFYLTDFLVRHFDRMVWQGLGLDRHPELLPMYFGNYTRLVYLAQTDDPELLAGAERAAERLGLSMLVERTGYGELETTLVELGGARR